VAVRRKRAFITGITGQDGHYMSDLLLRHGYRITGLARVPKRMPLQKNITIEQWDMRDEGTLVRLLAREQPDEFYNFAAFSTGSGMFDNPVAIGDVNGLAVARILEAIRTTNPATRFCQASSSEIFGAASGSPQSETSRFDPRSPYGAAKLYGHAMIGLYRQRFGTFACSAILFNHESPRRGTAFVTRKVTRAAASISRGLADHVELGDLTARRDWGFAGDYVRAMWLMLQQEHASDYIVATGVTHSVEDLCRLAFERVGLDYRDHVRVAEQPSRAPDALQLVGDPHKAARELGWSPAVSFEQLIALMVDADLTALDKEKGSEIG
jgi:GDPmannose 4,6-dehydratase